MEARDNSGARTAEVGDLRLDACVVVASGTMSAEDADRARDSGWLAMKAPEGGVAYLEVGGVVVAEGRLRKRRGKNAFVVTRTYQESGEVRS